MNAFWTGALRAALASLVITCAAGCHQPMSSATQLASTAACFQGSTLSNGTCLASTQACSAPNGSGQQTWQGSAWGSCTALSCNAGFTLIGGACYASAQSCKIDNGSGTRLLSGSSTYGDCQVTSCNSGYHQSGAACVANSRSCAVANGTGTQAWVGSSWGGCVANACNAGFTLANGACVTSAPPPPVGPVCNSGQTLFNGACFASSQTCFVANGTGTQLFSGGAYGSCMVASCNSGYHQESGAGCVSNTRSCTVANGLGTQSWSGTAWGACMTTSCNSGYAVNSAANSCQPVPFHGNSLTATSPLVGGLYHVYAPDIEGSMLYMGGWLTQADIGPDQLYFSQLSGGQWGPPQPLRWSNAGYTPGLIPGYHANDPSVVYIPTQNWHFMYYTALANQFTTPEQITSRNWVGFASSSDGGQTWFDSGVIIGQNNGLDNTGAWAPSALLNGNGEIWLYYHTGASTCAEDTCTSDYALPPKVLRSRLADNGWQRIATDAASDWSHRPLGLINVDVQYAYGKYWMVGNTSLSQIVLFLSDDGLVFYPYDGGSGLLIDGGTSFVLTPNLQVTSPNTVSIAFGFGPASGDPAVNHRSTSLQQWTFRLQ